MDHSPMISTNRWLGDSVKRTRQASRCLSHAAEAAVAAGVFLEGSEEFRFAELGPERGGDDQLGVGNLPEQEIAHAHFAAGADEQVRVGEVPGVEVFG